VTKSNEKTPINLVTTTSEDAALFGIDVDTIYFDWGSLDGPLVSRLACAVARGGGLFTMGSSSDGDSMYFSIRLGKQSKGYKCDSPETFSQLAPRMIDAWMLRAKKIADERKERM
jgi:hypothetical protein